MTEERMSSGRARRIPRRFGVLALGAALVASGAAAPARAFDPERAVLDESTPAQARLGAETRQARRALRDRMGRLGLLTTEPSSGAVRALARLDGFLTGPSADPAGTIVRRYARANRAVLGLDAAEVARLRFSRRIAGRAGAETLVFEQSAGGIPAADSGLRATLTADGRVVSVGGAPHPDLDAPAPPEVAAEEAHRAAATAVGSARRPAGPDREAGPERTTTFANGDRASLVLYEASDAVRLGWRVLLEESSTAYYDTIVDARSGAVQRRVNRVKSASARVYESTPGAPSGGGQVPTEVGGYLTPGAQFLTGPAARAFVDSNDDDVGEQVPPSEAETGDFDYPQSFYGGPGGPGRCPALGCTWDPLAAGSWRANASQAATQLFYSVNRFHDHLAAPPIGFTPESGAFNGTDPVVAQAMDGAGIANGLPDTDHLGNANMLTLPDGQSPRMQMYLFAPHAGDPTARAVSGTEDATIVYHEYGHGLVHRLLTDAQGYGALEGVQAGAIDEATADFYAMDFLVGQGLHADDAGTPDVAVGGYSVDEADGIRTQAIDCPVSSAAAVCTGSVAAGDGGYTFDDLGEVVSGPEVHADGEIWAQTLWDLRRRMIADHGQAAGVFRARRLVTDALRLAPIDPSFLDMRNAILLADRAAGGEDEAAIWAVFAGRGMGYFASTEGTDDAAPVANDEVPPPGGERTGVVRGVVREASTDTVQAGVTVAFSGFDTGLGEELVATTSDTGEYTISGVRPGTYPALIARGQGGLLEGRRPGVEVGAGDVNPQDFVLDRNVAAAAAGGSVHAATDDGAPSLGCGTDALIDGGASVWSPHAPDHPEPARQGSKEIVIRLSGPTDLSQVLIDPSAGCGDPEGSSLSSFEVLATDSTDPDDAAAYTLVGNGSFGPADNGRLNRVQPSAVVNDVRYVKLIAKGTQGEGVADDNGFMDVSELVVVGGSPARQTPATTLSAGFIQQTSARLNGAVRPGGFLTAYRFEYGRTNRYGRTTPFTQAGNGTSPVPVQELVEGLAPGTPIHYRLVAFRQTRPPPEPSVRHPGADRVLITQGTAGAPTDAQPPGATTSPAQGISQSSAALTATVNARGLPTTYRFEYGTTTAYGSTTATFDSGAGTMPSSRVAAIGALQPSTTYHYRVVATNAAGTTEGADRMLTTSAAPVQPPPDPDPPTNPPAPPPPAPPGPPQPTPPEPTTIPAPPNPTPEPRPTPRSARRPAAVSCATRRTRTRTTVSCTLRDRAGVRSARVRLSRRGRTIARRSGRVRSGRLPALRMKRAARRTYRLSVRVRLSSGRSRTVNRTIRL